MDDKKVMLIERVKSLSTSKTLITAVEVLWKICE